MNALPEAEYDFSRVPETELNSCLYYEYMRESEMMLLEIKAIRTQLAERARVLGKNLRESLVGFTFKRTHALDIQIHYYEIVLFLELAAVENFPDVPWQNLSGQDRHYLRDFVGKARRSDPRFLRKKEFPPLVIEVLSKKPSIGESTLNAWKASRKAHSVEIPFTKAQCIFDAKNLAPAMTKSLEYGFFQINLGYDQDQLLEALKDWLNENYPHIKEKNQKAPGRKSMHDKLNALGALRLLFHYRTFSAAKPKMKSLKEEPHGLYYEHRESFGRACDSAVSHFRTLLKLSEHHSPIHAARPEQVEQK
jgi:hypothetical protein